MKYGCISAASKIFTDIEFLWIWLFQSYRRDFVIEFGYINISICIAISEQTERVEIFDEILEILPYMEYLIITICYFNDEFVLIVIILCCMRKIASSIPISLWNVSV